MEITQPVFPTIRVGEPIQHLALSVFPLFQASDPGHDVDYLLSDEAISAGTVIVEEISESGSVPTLLVTNKSDRRILFLEGEELRGAKQNRVLNTTVLIGIQTKTTIPVSCVEQGRWRMRTQHFIPSGTSSSSKLRKRLKESVTRSLQMGLGHTSDQRAVWTEVSRQMLAMNMSSETSAMADTYDGYHDRIQEFRKRMVYVEGATGLVVAIGPRVVALDLFDKPATCRKAWDRLLSGFAMDALESPQSKTLPDATEVQKFLHQLTSAPWRETPAAGDGHEFRAETSSQSHASALVFETSLLHGSAMAEASA